MDEAELKARFNKEISAPDKELLWKWLEQRDFLKGVCRGELLWEDLEFEARLLANHQRDMLRIPKSFGRILQDVTSEVELTVPSEVELTTQEAEHAATLAPYLARQAALWPEVRAFREEKLGGGTLQPERVVTFLRSELRRLPRDEYADLEEGLEGNPPDVAYGEEEALKDLLGGWVNRSVASQTAYFDAALREAIELDSMKVPIEPDPPYLEGLMHLVHDETGRTLGDVGRRLTSRYPWTLRDAVWFALTGESPELTPLQTQTNSLHGTHTLIFLSWISEKSVRRAYRSLYGADNRPLGSKSLAAFRFVYERTEPGQIPKWTELTTLWNEQHPDPEDKFTDRSALRRAYKRAEQRLASPWVDEYAFVSETRNSSSPHACSDPARRLFMADSSKIHRIMLRNGLKGVRKIAAGRAR